MDFSHLSMLLVITVCVTSDLLSLLYAAKQVTRQRASDDVLTGTFYAAAMVCTVLLCILSTFTGAHIGEVFARLRFSLGATLFTCILLWTLVQTVLPKPTAHIENAPSIRETSGFALLAHSVACIAFGLWAGLSMFQPLLTTATLVAATTVVLGLPLTVTTANGRKHRLAKIGVLCVAWLVFAGWMAV